MALILVAPVFQDGNKWRFSDGGATFPAAILDEEFLSRVNNGERFGKGDVLQVELKIVQSRTGCKISVERQVLKVIEHRISGQQQQLL